jgi:hypothetical protein
VAWLRPVRPGRPANDKPYGARKYLVPMLWVAILAQGRRQDSLAGMSAVELAQAIWLLLITEEARAA